MNLEPTDAIANRASGVPIARASAIGECRRMVALLAVVMGAVLVSSRAAAQSTCTAGFAQFTCPSEPTDVVINQPMCLEANCTLRQIRIEAGGELMVPDEMLKADAKLIAISATRIIVEGGGVFQAGPLTNNRLTLTFTGARPEMVVVDRDGPTDPCPSEHFDKGIEVCSGGTLNLLGTKGVPALGGTSWTYLSAPAGDPAKYGPTDLQQGHMPLPTKVAAPVTQPDAQTIQVATASADWQPGDWIVIGTTSFSPFETEFVQIKTIVGTTITFNQPLKYYHFGSLPPDTGSSATCKDTSGRALPAAFCDGADKNYGVDERAEVGLISRNVMLTSDAGGVGRLHWGGEIKIRAGFTQVQIQGVQLEKFGKAKRGSYPIHFHLDGNLDLINANQKLVDANSIDHSYNKCITVHSTQKLAFSNNVCARIVGHIFYEEIGDELNITFNSNLGLGAMSNNFNIAETNSANPRKDLINNYWWTGDYLANGSTTDIGYDGFDIPNEDAHDNPVHGSCAKLIADGNIDDGLPGAVPQECPSGTIYTEPAAGFWLVNPSTTLTNNSIGGCQGVGVGYWYVTSPATTVQFLQLGGFQNNRVHACFDGLYGENQFTVHSAQNLNPHVGGLPGGQPVIATFSGLTATRNRDRGVWVRPLWNVVTNSAFATNRDSVTLLTAGGVDGTAPGAWDLLENSVLVGISANNVDRWGPCPLPDQAGPGTGTGGAKGTGRPHGFQVTNTGCIDRTTAAHDQIAKGYPSPTFNLAGYMIYDGPVRIFNDHFVNFKVDPTSLLDATDVAWLNQFSTDNKYVGDKAFIYEGDAALGWFQANPNPYPNATVSNHLGFYNVDLRHQIYTDEVHVGTTFKDSDKNTAIIDEDGTLTGLEVADSTGKQCGTTGATCSQVFPLSLNNLEINASRLMSVNSQSSVDECLSQGAQDTLFEGRPTSLLTPEAIGSLEFSALFPVTPVPPDDCTGNSPNPFCNDPSGLPGTHNQTLTFTKDSTDYLVNGVGTHESMSLDGRGGQGLWEPKITNGYGYTVAASQGIPTVVDVGVTDVVNANIVDVADPSITNPFYVRMGICYTSKTGSKHPQNAAAFKITRGFKGYGGSGVPTNIDGNLNQYYNKLADEYNKQFCSDLDDHNRQNLKLMQEGGKTGCPADGVAVPIPLPSGSCGTLAKTTINGNTYCIYPKGSKPLTLAGSVAELNPGGVPDPTKYYYDKKTGMLFFDVVQDLPNAIGPSPLGSCGPGTPMPNPTECPQAPESYYACPAPGCEVAIVRLEDSSYVPGPSDCRGPGGEDTYTYDNGVYAQNPPPDQNQLALSAGGAPVIVTGVTQGAPAFPHAAPSPTPNCPVATPTP